MGELLLFSPSLVRYSPVEIISFAAAAAVVQLPSRVRLFVTPWTAACLSLTISQSLPKFMFIASVMPSSHLILWCPLLILPLIIPIIRDFSNESAVHSRWPKYWSFSFSISSSSEYSLLISLKIDWFDLFAVHGLLRSLLQHHIQRHQFFGASPSLWSTLTTICDHREALTIQTFVGRVMSLLFNTLSRFVISFPPRSNHLLISWLSSLSTVILEPKERKSVTISTFYPSICHEVMGPDAMILVFLALFFKPTFSLSSFTFIRGSLVLPHFLP